MLGDSASELVEQFGTDTFKAVHDSDQDGLVYFAGDGRVEYVNRAALEMFGLDRSIIGEDIFEHHERDYEDFPVEIIQPSDHFDLAIETFEKGVPNRSEMVIIDGDERREIEVVWGPVHREGEIAGIVGSYRDVSPRPDIHDQLATEASRIEEQRRFLASIIDVLDDGILVFDDRATLQLINPAGARLLGVETPAEGTELDELLEHSTLEAPERFFQQLRRTASSEGSTTTTLLLDGAEDRTHRLDVRMTSIGRERTRIICTLSETTPGVDLERMRLLSRISALDHEGLELRALADRIVELVADTLSLDFVVLTQLDGSELAPLAWRGALLEDDMRVALEDAPSLRDALQSGDVRRLDAWTWRENDDGAIGQLVVPLTRTGRRLGTLQLGFTKSLIEGTFETAIDELDVAFVETLGGVVSGALHAVLDRELATTEQASLISVIERLPIGVALYTRRGEVVMVNSVAEEITGFDEWSDLNTDTRPFRVLDADGEPLARSEWPLFAAVHDEAPREAEVLFDFGHTQRNVQIGGAPLDGEDSTLYIGTLRDVTEQRRMNRRKDEFLSIASHELRSPLTPLTGVLQLARRQRERGRQVDLSLLTRAERQVSRLTRLIDGLLDLTRIERDRIDLEPRTVDFRSFVESRVEPWELNPKEIEIELSLPESSTPVRIDQDRVGQVLTNVVDNAIKYSNPNGVIRIDVSDAGDRVELAVEDDGVGMDEETVDHIFDQFFHGHDGNGGPRSMGLGLYICRQIIEQHQGDIAVESAKGVGTRVEITLPKRPSNSAASR